MTAAELKAISKDPEATEAALKFDNLPLRSITGIMGGEELRQRVTTLYDQSKVKVGTEDIVSRSLSRTEKVLVRLLKHAINTSVR